MQPTLSYPSQLSQLHQLLVELMPQLKLISLASTRQSIKLELEYSMEPQNSLQVFQHLRLELEH